MARFLIFPDAEALAGGWLRDYGLTAGDRVYSSLPQKPTFPLGIVKRLPIGRPAVKQTLDAAYLQGEAWGNTKSEAHDLAQEMRVALLEMAGQNLSDAFVTGVEDEISIGWLPDPPTGRDRYIFAVRLYAHIAA